MRRMKLKAALFAAAMALFVVALAAQNPTVRIHAATVLDGSGKDAAERDGRGAGIQKSRRLKPEARRTPPTTSGRRRSCPA